MLENFWFFFHYVVLRARASIAIARISYGNSVRPSVRLSDMTRYRFMPR